VKNSARMQHPSRLQTVWMMSKPLGAVNLGWWFQADRLRGVWLHRHVKPELQPGCPQELPDKRLLQAKRCPLF
jgi:hypothetical protein